MEPVTFLDGELRDHRHWRLPERQRGLVERAAQAHRSRGWSDPIEVHDPDPSRAERRARGLELGGGMGPLRLSRHVGRVIAVR